MNLPSYQQLNPIITYYDKYSYGMGNPDLEPVYINNLSLSALYGNVLNLYVEYSFIKDQILEVPITDSNNPQVIKVMPVNVASNHQINVGAGLSKRIGKHSLSLYGTFLAQKSEMEDFVIDEKRFFTSFYATANYAYRFGKYIDCHVKINYTGKTEDAISVQYPSFNTGVSFNFNFFDKKLQMGISCNDIFHTKDSDYKVKYLNITNLQKNNADSRFFSVHFKYAINKVSHKNKVKNVDDVLNRL